MTYFPNNIEQVMEDRFPDDIPFDVFLSDLHTWSIPSSVCCVIRAENKRTGLVKEYTYQRTHAARRRLHQLLVEDPDTWEILIADDDSIHLIIPPD